ncbi:MAG: dTDP-4-dehydrorhamnose reductase [Aigarchaeota archaeon]|nr:dTDP-4-dehydrorhamnose reductase [Aigarchaeota archaeon]MDW8092647.1 dTDP-4-dehydrorhamnose reductase [Nitrososphaerota archaeon]
MVEAEYMRVLVTGGSSLPGFRTIRALLRHGHQVVAVCHNNDVLINDEKLLKVKADICDSMTLADLFDKYRPEAVIHMAAIGDVDRCEKERHAAWSVNVEGTVNVGRLASKHGSSLVYLSTDYVFDGAKGSYEEGEPPRPANYYGLTKLCGEIALSTLTTDVTIVRASTIYGFGPGRQNFAKVLLERLSKRENVNAVVDQYTSPTEATLLAEAITEVLEKHITGVLHVVGERFSRYEFALKVAEALGLDRSLIVPVKMQDFNWAAPRPKDSSLKCDKTRSILNTDFHTTLIALKALRQELSEVRE